MLIRIAPAALLALGACTHGGFVPSAQDQAVSRNAMMPAPLSVEQDADGTCWANDTTPAVYEQVMGEIEVLPAELAPDGTVLNPPVYRRAPVPRVVEPRRDLRFQVPCPPMMTQVFVESLQRALAARGYFAGNVTGLYDAPTAAAVRRYQKDRGLNSNHLSLDSARALGLVEVDLQALGLDDDTPDA